MSSGRGTAETNPTKNHKVVGSIPDLVQWVKDLALLWLRCRPAVVALIRLLAWGSPDAMGVALKKTKKKKKERKSSHATLLSRFTRRC